MKRYGQSRFIRLLILMTGSFLLASCAGPRPVLYPNSHLKTVGQAQADRDIEECKEMAGELVSSSNTGKGVAKSTAMGAGVGAAGGAVGGTIRGSAAQGSMIGAAAGATAGLVRGLFRGTQPNRTYQNLVNRCLAKRGYESVGWD